MVRLVRPDGEGVDPRDAAKWDAVDEASELLQEGSFEEGLQELKRLIQQDPMNPYAYNLLGICFFELKQLEPARDAFQAAIKVSPDYLGARIALSHVHRELKKPLAAIREAKEALIRFPGDGEAQHALGLAEAAHGNRPDARKHLQGFLDANPEFEVAQEVRQIIEMLGMGKDDEPFEPS